MLTKLNPCRCGMTDRDLSLPMCAALGVKLFEDIDTYVDHSYYSKSEPMIL